MRAVRGRSCPLCDATPGTACQPRPEGDHLARYLDAYTAGQLTRAYLAMVLGELVVIDTCAVVTGPRVTYVPDTTWDGWWADLRDGDGRRIDNGWGPSKDEALAHLRGRTGGSL